MHLNSLTPMRISGTPRSFLNLDSRCPTSIEGVVIGGDLDSPLPTLPVGLVSMNILSSLSVVARRPPASEEVICGSAALKRLLLDRSQPAEAPGELEERGRQVLARLADGERGDERGGGGASAPAFPTIRRSSGFRYRVDGIVWQHLKNVRQLQVAARYARLGRWAPGNKLVHG